jgi:putative transposase
MFTAVSGDRHRLCESQGHRVGDGGQLQDAADHSGDRDGRTEHRSSAGAIFYSDRGSNYTSAEFAAVLERLGIRQSVGRTGICLDNALAESFNAALKVERVHRTAYPTRKKARDDIARYIEVRYNRMRLHSALGYRTPQEAYDEYLSMQAAA